MLSVEAFAERIKRARPDIAVNDPQAGQTEEKEPFPMVRRFSGARENGVSVGSRGSERWRRRVQRICQFRQRPRTGIIKTVLKSGTRRFRLDANLLQ